MIIFFEKFDYNEFKNHHLTYKNMFKMIYKFFLTFLYYKKVSLQRNISVRGTLDHGESRIKFDNFC
jgi:hypothetical protein